MVLLVAAVCAQVGSAWNARNRRSRTRSWRTAGSAQVQQITRHTSDPSSRPQRSLLLAVYAATLQPHDTVGLLGAIDGVRQQLRAAAGLPLDGHAADVAAAAYSPDRRWLATGRADGLVRLYDLTAADPRAAVHDLAGHQGRVAGLAFAADGRRLVSAGSDGTLRLWQVDAASPVAGRVISVNALGPIRRARREPRWAVARLRRRVGSAVPLALAGRRAGGSAL